MVQDWAEGHNYLIGPSGLLHVQTDALANMSNAMKEFENLVLEEKLHTRSQCLGKQESLEELWKNYYHISQ